MSPVPGGSVLERVEEEENEEELTVIVKCYTECGNL